MPLKLRNRTLNTAGVAPRSIGTVWYGGLDALKTTFNYPKQIFEILSDTTIHTKNVFKNAFGKGKWYQKIVNGIASPFIATGTMLEWAVRAVLNPTRNLFCNARDSIGNVLVNEGNTIKWTAHHEDPSTFKFQELQDRNVNKTNRISKRQWWVNSPAPTPTPAPAPTTPPTP